MKQVWTSARTNYQIYDEVLTKYTNMSSPTTHDERVLHQAKRSASQALRKLAEHGLIDLEFEDRTDNADHQRQRAVYQAAKEYFAEGNDDSSERFIAQAVRALQKQGNKEQDAKAVAVIWAMFTEIWADIDTWMKIMGFKLRFYFKSEIARDAPEKPAKKRKPTTGGGGGTRRLAESQALPPLVKPPPTAYQMKRSYEDEGLPYLLQ